MPQIGPLEIMVVCVVALIVFGPKRLPDIARQVGRAMAEMKRQANDMRSEFESGMKVEDEKPAPGSPTEGDPEPPTPALSGPEAPIVHKGTTTELGYRTTRAPEPASTDQAPADEGKDDGA